MLVGEVFDWSSDARVLERKMRAQHGNRRSANTVQLVF